MFWLRNIDIVFEVNVVGVGYFVEMILKWNICYVGSRLALKKFNSRGWVWG